MKRFIIFVTLITALTVFFTFNAFSQTADSVKTKKCKIEPFAGVGITSQYMVRGTMLANRPTIQPYLGLNIGNSKVGNFEIGSFGALGILNDYYEADLYVSYSYKFMKLSVIDYYIDISGNSNNRNYFDYSTNGGHHISCDLMFIGVEKFPLKLTASTLIYSGWDLYGSGKKRFTTYFEARYPYKGFEFFAGGLTGQSYFYSNDAYWMGTGFNIVNVGIAYTYKIKVSDKYDIPIIVQTAVNPQMQKFYLTLGVTF